MATTEQAAADAASAALAPDAAEPKADGLPAAAKAGVEDAPEPGANGALEKAKEGELAATGGEEAAAAAGKAVSGEKMDEDGEKVGVDTDEAAGAPAGKPGATGDGPDVASATADAAAGEPAEATPVLGGKRERKRTVKFEAGGNAEPTMKRRERKQGTGVPLGQIPNAAFLINEGKAKDEEMLQLHRFCFGSNGTPAKRKENLRQFSGFVFSAEKDRANMRARMNKESVGVLRKIARLVDVALPSSSAHKAEIVSALLAFLEKPAIDEDRVDLAAKARERKAKRAKAIEDKKNGIVQGKAKGKAGKKKKATDTDSESGTDNEDEEDMEPRAAKPAKKKQKKAPPEPEEESDEDDEDVEMGDGDDADGEDEDEDGDEEEVVEEEEAPPAKKAEDEDDDEPVDGGPSNAKLREATEKLLKQPESDNLTMREIRTRLEASMKCELSSRMGFLRKFVGEKRKAAAKGKGKGKAVKKK